jgi:propanol-preferring alcohol dehydrogenase
MTYQDEVTIEGSIVGTHRDVEDVFSLHTLGRTRVLRETRPLQASREHEPRRPGREDR